MTEDDFLKELGNELRNAMGSVVSDTSFKYSRMTYKLPFKTGKLSHQGFRLVSTGDGKWDLYIDTNLVPYAKYLDDPGKVSQGYWSKAMEYYIRKVADDLGGSLSK